MVISQAYHIILSKTVTTYIRTNRVIQGWLPTPDKLSQSQLLEVKVTLKTKRFHNIKGNLNSAKHESAFILFRPKLTI